MNKALLIGINAYPSAPLRGCVNDVNRVAEMLVAKKYFKAEEIRILTDGRATTAGCWERLQWLRSDVKQGDKRFLLNSSHGTQVASRNDTGEVDRLDEVMCPVDYDGSAARMITDNQLHELFRDMPDGVPFNWLADCCHSEELTRNIPAATAVIDMTAISGPQVKPLTTIEGLMPWVDEVKTGDWNPPQPYFVGGPDSRNISGSWTYGSPGGITKISPAVYMQPRSYPMTPDMAWRIRVAKEKNLKQELPRKYNVGFISGCRAEQTSADAFIDGRYCGAATHAFLHCLEKFDDVPLHVLTRTMQEWLKSHGYSQQPQAEGNLIDKPFLRG